MVTIRASEGTATFYLDPYPGWEGDPAMITRGDALLRSVNDNLIKKGLLDPNGGTFAQDSHDAYLAALKLSGIEIVEAARPGPDPPSGLVH